MIDLAAFLGNPGKAYSGNRHNAGFLLADKLPFGHSLSWQKKFKGLYAAIDRSRLVDYLPEASVPPAPANSAECRRADDRVTEGRPVNDRQIESRLHFIKPQTYMNLSGESVAQTAAFFKIKTDAIIVVHDELELPLGTISLKFSGGLGGHNGLRSMKACFGSPDFWRIKIGIGRPDSRLPGEGGPPGSGEGITDWVLSNFTSGEVDALDRTLDAAAGLLLMALTTDPQALLKEWAKKKVI